jgi:membrane-bound ClpP family serine protease
LTQRSRPLCRKRGAQFRAGKIKVRGKYWDAVAPAGAHVEPGAKVRITAINGLQVAVKPDSSGE